MTPERREEIMKGATGSPNGSDDERQLIKAFLVVDEEDEDGVRPVGITICKNCKEDPCVWEQNTASGEKWAKRKLQSEPGFTTGHTSLEMKRGQADNCKKCFRYAARLV
jgi:hypothetical protein